MTIPWWRPVLGDEEAARVVDVLAGNFPNDGQVTEEFAARIAGLCGVAHGVGVSSGSAALYCALAACGVGAGDEVIVPDLTFVASANAVTLTGARPILVDVERDSFHLDPRRVESALTPRTRAVMPVHVNGRGGRVAEIVALARERGIAVVEDASEALGSRRDGRPLGSFGDAAAFSFAPSKLVTTGQGGVVVTDDGEIARRVRELKDQGRAERGTGGADEHPTFGFNFKLTNVHAAIGLAQLDRLPERLAMLRRLREWYVEELAELEPALRLVPVAPGESLQWIDALVEDRARLVAALAERGIESREFWYPLHTLPPYAHRGDAFPSATWASRHGLWLPSALTLTRDDVAEVGEAIRSFVTASVA